MGVRLLLSCGGCDATAEGTAPLRRRFHGTQGDWGIGTYSVDHPETLTPAGWVMFDPYTQATYCADCWAQIDPDEVGDETRLGDVVA